MNSKVLFFLSPHNYYDHKLKKSNNRPLKLADQFALDEVFTEIYIVNRIKPRLQKFENDSRKIIKKGVGYKIYQCNEFKNTKYIEHNFPFGYLEDFFVPMIIKSTLRKISYKDITVLVADPKSAGILRSNLGCGVFDAYDDWLMNKMYQKNRHYKALEKGYKTAKEFSDIMICNTDILMERFYNGKKTVLISNTSSIECSNTYLNQNNKVKKVGYIGNIYDRIDFDLFKDIVKTMKNLDFIIIGKYIGPEDNEKKKFENLTYENNVTYIPGVPYEQVSEEIAKFDVCIIPHQINEFTLTQDSMKMYDFLSIGKPVVTTAVPPSNLLSEYLYIAEGYKEFVEKINMALVEDEDLQLKRINYINENNWSSKTKQLYALLNEVKAQ
ncbi:glycosyltransferase [Paenibacillus urinalis]|uniref:Glycosyltransferase n=1 Tax=Paenibacillus urinalis TaxID=521520 RepID=A0ABY7XCC2_9BACL|nr:glycosyltransferase [Paenibacillus urinalis]WDH99812.1 glycosyltransferase [Paenibacillus urinalis]WDI03442.1 glycosyltransferase [Paenibacillus urinalis]SGI75504.1 Glycosyl transferases group 1 [Mycobacterium tuberculosis]